jgi:type IV secretory pathway TrbD component
VAGLVFLMLVTSSLAFVSSALWLGLAPWFAFLFGVIPFLVHYVALRPRQKAFEGRVLVISPEKPWQLAFYSEVSGLTDSIEVIVTQHWYHLFGLSLGLKFHHRPHNMSKTALVVVWRQCTHATVFREVALQATRQIEGAHRHSKGDSA